MFISARDILDTTGVTVDENTIRIAQLMIETHIGRSEVEIDDASDLQTLARATLFQAIYINKSLDVILEQVAVTRMTLGEATSVFDTSISSPYMAPMAVFACRRLSWRGFRTIKTGPLFDTYRPPRPVVEAVEE